MTARLQRLLRRLEQAAGSNNDGKRRSLLLPLLSPSNGASFSGKPQQTPPSSSQSTESATTSAGTRLGDVMWKPSDEFPGRSTLDQEQSALLDAKRDAQVLARIARAAFRGVCQPSGLVMLGVCSCGVLSLSAYEATLLLASIPVDAAHVDAFSSIDAVVTMKDTLRFVAKYASENFLASCLWDSRDPELIARALDLDPSTLLAALDPSKSAVDAAQKLRTDRVATLRCMVAGLMVITQLLSIMRSSMSAALGYSESVFAGHEPPLRGIQERIIRLAGASSDVTEVSMTRYGAHILPVYEQPALIRHLVALWSMNGRVPCIWNVAAGRYGYRHSWAALEIDEDFMLRTTTGKFVLCMEADASRLDSAHDLRRASETSDLTIEDAAQAYRLIERKAALALKRPFRSLCVFLGDARQLCDTGGTRAVTVQERIQLKKEVDVLIDAKAPLLLAILKWCGRFVDDRKTIVLDVTPRNYRPLQFLLESNGYTVLSPAEAGDQQVGSSDTSKAVNNGTANGTAAKNGAASSGENNNSDSNKTVPPTRLPRLVYYPTTAATINAVHASLTSGSVADPRQCCVLINSPFGIQHLSEIAEAEGERFYPVCAAEIYDDYFRQVRIWTRMGHSPVDIQRELDARFAVVRDVQDAIAAMEDDEPSRAELPSPSGA